MKLLNPNIITKGVLSPTFYCNWEIKIS